MKAPAAPTRPSHGSQPRAERTRASILEEAVAHILEAGLAGANVKAIAQRAGVTWGVVQYHFGDREGLLAAVVDKGFDELATALAVSPSGRSGDVRDRVRDVVETAWSAMSSPTSRAAIEILIGTRATPGSAARKQLSRLASTFAELAQSITDDLDATQSKAIGDLLLTNIRGLVTTQLIMPRQIDTATERRMLIDVLSTYIDTTAKPGI
ncbi:hypothetical protein AU197_09600 [Mycobacterium sp. IS-1590]|uniref:TetR/AcrR family transcriptional regulator n=1 Tax=Mycobacterium sp. IS-1590 TaxID=1772286 RepID=UPI000746FA65|nr:TetR/AcrR family transcriptional regulator [Mycobacterium sp. IS-1590]KUI37975.1 hypothetical protein AU197_09600 [Mycobacterium sp. IS-1590]